MAIKVTKMMKVDCDSKFCKNHFIKEVEFDGFNGVNVNFIKDAGFKEMTTALKKYQLCIDCNRRANDLLSAFINREKTL